MEPLRGSFSGSKFRIVFYTIKASRLLYLIKLSISIKHGSLLLNHPLKIDEHTMTLAGSYYCRITIHNRLPVQLHKLNREKLFHGPEKKSLTIA